MPSLESGIRIAHRYVLQERLGDGGHAEVWAAVDNKDQQRVALKFLHAANGGAEDAWRFLQHESSIVHRLDHPGVLHVSAPQRDGHTVFLAMEFAAGGNATKLRGAPWQQIVPVLREIAQILEHVHSRGVVHRDIKSGNVMFTADGAVRLTDFGTAARTGSNAAPAVGSPYSSSPQQLAGEAAVTADDVYGLGALAYELLSAYPPHYPNFDAQRMQSEPPAPCIPVHAAPVALVTLVMSMLALTPRERPDLQQVMQQLDALQSQATLANLPVVPGSQLIRAVDARSVRTAPLVEHSRVSPTMWLGAAALLAIVAFFLLPRFAPVEPAAPPVAAAPAKAEVEAAAQSSAEPVPAAAPSPDPQAALVPNELLAGDAALAAMRPAEARAAFQRVLLLQPQHAAAKRGLVAATALERDLASYAEGMKAEAAGEAAVARTAYETLLKSRPDFQPARAGLARLAKVEVEKKLDALLSQGTSALLAGRVTAAESAYTKAAAIAPNHPTVADGLARIKEIRTNQLNANDLAAGLRLEDGERWSEAVAHYQSVLTRNPSLLFAQDGLARSQRRAALDTELADYLARPERLTAKAVRLAAERALARANATTPRSARLVTQIQALQARLGSVTVPVRFELRSDNNTRVFLAPLGELGSFASRELQLPPGNYTVIGRRDGYRDVRYDLTLLPEQKMSTLTVTCGDRI